MTTSFKFVLFFLRLELIETERRHVPRRTRKSGASGACAGLFTSAAARRDESSDDQLHQLRVNDQK